MAVSKLLPKIAIIGAGPSGLTLASLLHKNLPSSSRPLNLTIFELRPAPTPNALRTPSGSLDLHPGSGLLAVEKCGLTSQFKTMINSDCTEEMIIADKSGKACIHDEAQNGNRPEISRNALQHLLLSSLPKDIIRWNTKVTSVTPGLENKWKIAFGNEQQEEFDLVVGADGAWSKARDAMSGVSKPVYSGILNLSFIIPNLSTKYPTLASLVRSGSYMACGDHKAVISQRAVLDSTSLYIQISSPSPRDAKLENLPPAELKRKLLSEEYFQSWGQGPKDLIAAACDSMEGNLDARPLYMLPSDARMTHTPGVTLIGDAAHLTTPNGEGVNIAMLDALELSEAIISSVGNEEKLDKVIAAFEEKMFERGKENAEDAINMKKLMLGENAPEGFVALFNSHQEAAMVAQQA